MLKDIYIWLSGAPRRGPFAFAFICMLVGGLGFLLYMSTQALTDEAKLPFQLQRAGTPQEFGQVLSTWSVAGKEQLLESIRIAKTGLLWFDSIWPLGYGLLGILVLARLTRPIAAAGQPGWALLLTSCFFFAALFDFAENFTTVELLNGIETRQDLSEIPAAQFERLRFFTRSKWTTIFAGSVIALALWARYGRQKP